ncbi:hypothetical protein BDK51DRAFT_36289 [Blyttiomyces helicus]|uniref:Pre-mRNA-splicing factor Syf1-like N-terminal HAT-repeats domain-containing protein n=1 Tax=Blyttiomyces helicus TaxID=388810 RepID=A0A4V1IRX5_9FUNG|nr:hypothetical protein BDK51DRAFT_36289 [Blyttiomyces helicus]|eukprot:RKO91577.1 hypothetical protein BDK51DRAFT_36289 [Blyttiomyces helicus]
MSKVLLASVKNKNPAAVQITAEQILREASERQDADAAVPTQKITDREELDEYKLRKRKTFEDVIRRNRMNIGAWLKYAAWEESQEELDRARSVFERSLDIDHRNQTLWLKYAEMEMKHRNVNRARNIFDRAVTMLPRVDAFWYKYAYMEELIENVAGARQVFERWLKWEPAEDAWAAYVKMEKRYHETDRAREILRRFVGVHPQPKNWLKWAKFEESVGKPENARAIYEECIDTLGDDFLDQNVFISFAKFETRLKEIDRARIIYKYALDKYSKGKADNLYNVYSQFEKQYGGKEGIEDVIIGKRRVKYEEELAANPKNYDVWFDYARLEESGGDAEKVREVYERAISQVPPIAEKRYWRRYIYLWIFYAVWEETEAKDADRAKQVYTQLLQLIPHKSFTFAKAWLLYARFLLRQMDPTTARRVLFTALHTCPKERLFKGYIELEIQLREFDRVRALYERYLQWNAANCAAWIKYAELESFVGDIERARGIFEIAVGQPVLDMPEVLWKAYIDFEVGTATGHKDPDWERARELYERLLQRTEHVKVWISFAKFESTALDNLPPPGPIERARAVLTRAYSQLKKKESKEERVVLLEAWKELERALGTDANLAAVVEKMPKAVKKRRRVEGGEGWEEYFDYIFPDDETDRPNFKLLAMAHQWKMKMAEMAKKKDEGKDEEEEEEEEEEGRGKRDKGKGPASDRDADDDDDEEENGAASDDMDE